MNFYLYTIVAMLPIFRPVSIIDQANAFYIYMHKIRMRLRLADNRYQVLYNISIRLPCTFQHCDVLLISTAVPPTSRFYLYFYRFYNINTRSVIVNTVSYLSSCTLEYVYLSAHQNVIIRKMVQIYGHWEKVVWKSLRSSWRHWYSHVMTVLTRCWKCMAVFLRHFRRTCLRRRAYFWPVPIVTQAKANLYFACRYARHCADWNHAAMQKSVSSLLEAQSRGFRASGESREAVS